LTLNNIKYKIAELKKMSDLFCYNLKTLRLLGVT